jgi:hypothetical protein
MIAMLISVFAVMFFVSPPSFDHSLFNAALKANVKNGRVNYAAIGNDENFKQYVQSLQTATPTALGSKAEKLAFWFNAYNALTIDLITRHPDVKSIRDVTPNAWKAQLFSIGGKSYTLDDIEHKIIIGELGEVRAHFGLVCAAKSCPILRNDAYQATKISQQLDEQTRLFLNNPQRNRFDGDKKTVYLSKLFEWYKSDFVKAEGSIQKFIAPYLAKADDKTLLMLPDVKIEYLDYDWSLNN